MKKCDLLVLGGGPGGYVAALRASKEGLDTILVEENEVGGICLNRGCIPTKTIISSVKKLSSVRNGAEFGLEIEGKPKLNISTVIGRKNKTVSTLVKGIHQLLKGSGVELIKGHGRINKDKTVSVANERIETKNIIIATGSSWKSVPGIEIDSVTIVTSDHLLDITEIPESLCVIGGGVVGCEYASIFNALGSEVTIVEAMDNLIPAEDTSLTKVLAREFKKKNINLYTGTTVQRISLNDKGADIELSNGKNLSVVKVLVAVGRKPNIEGFGLEETGVEVEKGAIVTNEKMKTNIDGVYAVGDVNGKYMLAHTASREGVVAVENILGRDSKMSYHAVPRPIFTIPEACGTGLTEAEIVESGLEFNTGRFSYMALSKAGCDGLKEGQITVYTDKESNVILGASIVGENSAEIISELTLAVEKRMVIDDIASTIHAHPTLSEIVHEGVEDCIKMATHKVYR